MAFELVLQLLELVQLAVVAELVFGLVVVVVVVELADCGWNKVADEFEEDLLLDEDKSCGLKEVDEYGDAAGAFSGLKLGANFTFVAGDDEEGESEGA